MTAVQIAGVELCPAADGPVVQAVVTLDCVPSRPKAWVDVATIVAQALVARDCQVEGVYAVFDSSSAGSAVLEFGKVLALDEADGEALGRLGAGSTVAYAAVAWTKGGPRDGEKEAVLAVTIEVAPRASTGPLGRLRGERGGGSAVVAVGAAGGVRHVQVSRRADGVGGLSRDLAAAYPH